jgi:DNA-binding CsgD family transcriptional regulator
LRRPHGADAQSLGRSPGRSSGGVWPALGCGASYDWCSLARGELTLLDRRDECAVLNRLLERARAGRSGALVVRGEAGIGKTALLQFAIESASDLQVARAVGVESEKELAFAALHQVCAPMLDRLDRLPGPQRDALAVTFGLSEGAVPDRFFVGLAVLGLLAEVAEDRPLVCVVDDAQWLDRASAQALAFVARRLLAESVVLLFGGREPCEEFAGLPELVVGGLWESDARELLRSVIRWSLDERVADQIVAETRGNPLALLEMPRGLSPTQLAGWFGLPVALSLEGRIQASFLGRIEALPPDTQSLLLVAAAEPTGDPALLWRAAKRLGVRDEMLEPAAGAGLLEVGTRMRFRHPLVRSTVYRTASLEQRRRVHRALAEATDAQADPDRRAWHLAEATGGPDEDIAAELEHAAGRAQARGGVAAAAAFLERATMLTVEPSLRADRALAAAQTKIVVGALDAVQNLLATAEAGPLTELQQAQADLVRAQLAYVTSRGNTAAPLLLGAATRLEPIAPELARATYLDALSAAIFAGRLAAPGGSLPDVTRAASAASPPTPRAADLFLDGLAASFGQGYAAGLPILRQALSGFENAPTDPEMHAGSVHIAHEGYALLAAVHTWDDDAYLAISDRWAKLCRQAGALSELPLALTARALILMVAGDLDGAASLVEELRVAAEATGIGFGPYAAMGLAAFQGNEAEGFALIDATVRDASLRGEGNLLSGAEWARAVLNNGVGRYEQALAAAQRSSDGRWELLFSHWALAELTEAAARVGRPDDARPALERLAEIRATGTDWALGVEVRSRALLSDGGAAEGLYREAIERLGATRVRVELARAHLLYGEWLRRERRRVDAREQLRTAHEMFTAMGVWAFAGRAERELLATGERVRKRAVETREDLTAQEAQIARLARDGVSNAEIAARMFISRRTVEYHLSKVFTKLGISSRHELDRVLPPDRTAALAL